MVNNADTFLVIFTYKQAVAFNGIHRQLGLTNGGINTGKIVGDGLHACIPPSTRPEHAGPQQHSSLYQIGCHWISMGLFLHHQF